MKWTHDEFRILRESDAKMAIRLKVQDGVGKVLSSAGSGFDEDAAWVTLHVESLSGRSYTCRFRPASTSSGEKGHER